MEKRRNLLPFRAGVTGAVLHLVLLGLFAQSVLSSHDPVWPIMWVAFLLLDFPIGFLIFLVPNTFFPDYWPGAPKIRLYEIANFLLPLGYFGIVGTLWWFALFFGFTKLIERFRRSKTESSTAY